MSQVPNKEPGSHSFELEQKMVNISMSENAKTTTTSPRSRNTITNRKSDSETDSAGSDWEYQSDSDNCRGLSDIRPCPLRYVSPCDWSGALECPQEMIKHCLKAHPKNIFITNNKKIVVPRFNEIQPRKYFVLFCVFDNIFRLTWYLDVKNRLLHFAMYFIYDFGSKAEYFFEVDFLNARRKVIKIKGPCLFLNNEENVFLDSTFFTLPYDLVARYCDEHGTLSYTVTVFKE